MAHVLAILANTSRISQPPPFSHIPTSICVRSRFTLAHSQSSPALENVHQGTYQADASLASVVWLLPPLFITSGYVA